MEQFSGFDGENIRRIPLGLGERIVLQDDKEEDIVAVQLGAESKWIYLELPEGQMFEIDYRNIERIAFRGADIRGVYPAPESVEATTH